MIYDSPISYSIHLVICESASSPATPPPTLPLSIRCTPPPCPGGTPGLCSAPSLTSSTFFSLVELISEKPINHSSSVIKHLQYGILEALRALWNLSRWAAGSLILDFLFLPQTLTLPTLSSLFMAHLFTWSHCPEISQMGDLEGENLSL